ncbi:alpha/beta fold hydrolase [Mesorhizobium sp. BR1-1-16]|uniref:alpha/beta hydrolase n=1 Tax=Mesorhizobium sp. BR1-1-16 TaxID=2876653 RepID=UPI001CCF77C6|nr:alpha/beta fold hydrolase [Mesorhizobium sp. BR1-1-16]MBZ9936925.1 alpha/beta fold hydrolase [Mesorhizobium sp. BR1-1-16]
MPADEKSHSRRPVSQLRPEEKTYVLVHGAWHGGWCWRDVAALLRAGGHHVTAPTQTGLGERRHLLNAGITLDTFVADIINHIEAEELDDIILVGHSHAGAVITGVADLIPKRIRHLVYLDAAIIESGHTAFSLLAPDVAAARRKLVVEQGNGLFLPVPEPSAFGIPEGHPKTDWVRRRLTPHPVGSYESTLNFAHPIGNGRRRTYVACTDPFNESTESSRAWVKRQPAGWTWRELATGHDAMILAPTELAAVLGEID